VSQIDLQNVKLCKLDEMKLSLKPGCMNEMLTEICSIRLMVPMVTNGSICLGDGMNKEDVVNECKLWMASKRIGLLGSRGVGADHDQTLYHWMDAVLPPDGGGKAEGVHLNLTVCEVLKEAIDDACAFDMDAINKFSEKLKTSDGFSLAFWVKAVDSTSLTESGKFFPHLSLLHSISPPEPYFAMSKMSDWTYNTLDVRSYDSNGNPAKQPSFLQDLSISDWNFVAISNKFGSGEEDYDSFAMQNSRVLSNYRGLDFLQGGQSINSAFFKAIEVNTPMLISPIMLVPKFRLAKELQEEYNTHVDLMAPRLGPVDTNRIRKQTRVHVEKLEFRRHSTLMAAPILFQTMARKTEQCPFKYGSEFLGNIHSKAVREKCDPSTYVCDNQTLIEVHSIMSCLKNADDNVTFFGLEPTDFNGATGYADFLSSIADNDFVYRDGLMPTSTFVNSATQLAQVVFVFFTPGSGLVSGATFA
jgi:hypothetical protein